MKRNLLLILSIIICNSYAVAAQEIMRNGKAAPDYFSLEVNTFATARAISGQHPIGREDMQIICLLALT